MEKAIFIDKDGTLIPNIPYNVSPDLIRIESNALDGLKQLKANGYLLIIISNQAGIALGKFKIESLNGVEHKIRILLSEENIHLDGFYYCPHHPEGTLEEYRLDCLCRKPKPGMILKAAEELGIDLIGSWIIGDILHDIEAGNRAGCKTILIDKGNETEWLINDLREPDFTVSNINQAAEYILYKTDDSI